jgi:hypothetical protein
LAKLLIFVPDQFESVVLANVQAVDIERLSPADVWLLLLSMS